jgi:hypothetical protein
LSSGFRISFELTPLAEVEPWLKDDQTRHLHWYALSLGQYWIQVGDETLLEYSEAVCRRHPHVKHYCEYQVARLYEDLFGLAPGATETIPEDLRVWFKDSGQAISELFEAWQAQPREDSAVDDIDVIWSLRSSRLLDSGYLRPRTDISCWSTESHVHIIWDNRDKFIDGLPAWTAQRGEFSVNKQEFVKEIRRFQNEFLAQMDERVQEVLAGALPADIYVDKAELVETQRRELQIAERVSMSVQQPTEWQEIRAALRLLLAQTRSRLH